MKILILGVTGQDGAWLSKLLLEEGHEVFGVVRRTSSPSNFWRLADLGILGKIHLIPGDVTDITSLIAALKFSKPQECYNLSAMSFVKVSFDMPFATANIDALGALNVLEAIRVVDDSIRVYFAGSSEMWGRNGQETNDEDARLVPASPYALSKVFGFQSTRMYREAYGIYAVTGILTNHDSSIRGLEFVTRKTTNYIGGLVAGKNRGKLQLGNLNAIRDFGYAPQFVASMPLMLRQSQPDDFVVATGIGHSVKDVLRMAFEFADEDWKDHVEIADSEKRPLDVDRLVGDASKARRILGWTPQVTSSEIIEIMVQKDIERWKRYSRGEVFPWDVTPSA